MLRNMFLFLLWPSLLCCAILANYVGMQTAHPILWFNVSYFALGVTLFALERTMPHERQWLVADGQLVPDIGHTLLSKSAVQILIATITIMGVTETVEYGAADWWPYHWPLAAQVLLGLTLAEFALYWAHRFAHEWQILWRFHAIHHSVKRLWFVNTGRFHFVDTAVSVIFGLGLAFALGVPENIIVWVSAITAYVGLLSHCNVEMKFGALNYMFQTPGLHRWHHSLVPEEGNRNYGENLMIFDHIFRTFFNPSRQPPVEIGIREFLPGTFAKQVWHPFQTGIK